MKLLPTLNDIRLEKSYNNQEFATILGLTYRQFLNIKNLPKNEVKKAYWQVAIKTLEKGKKMKQKKTTIAKLVNKKTVHTNPKYHLQNTDAISLMESLGANSVDLVLTDPPYQISRKTNFKSGEKKGTDVDRFRVDYEFGQWDAIPQDEHATLMSNFAKQAFRVLRNGGVAVVWYDLWKIESLRCHLENAGFRMFRLIEWEKTNPVPINAGKMFLSNAKEQAIVCVKGSKPTFNAYYDSGLFRMPITRENRFHPTQKPIALMKELILKLSNEGETVLDPFSGSGTTLAASIETGRHSIGSEMNPIYYQKTLKRLKESHKTVAQTALELVA
jgi:site-specific DNA-methyltransferase (adenine-specific)